jgi:peptide/nickel transport system substrate-binding protein
VLRANPSDWGAKRPAFGAIVIRNMTAAAQLLNIQRGSHEIALDLSADQAETLRGKRGVRVTSQPGVWVVYAFANADPQISAVTSDARFPQALRDALGYGGLVSVAAGAGSRTAPRASRPRKAAA